MVPEVPLDEYVKGFRYIPPAEPKEITMRGEARVLPPKAPASSDASATVPTDAPAAARPISIVPAEDVRQRLGLEDSPDDDRHDRPRFLDFSGPALPPEKPARRESTLVGPSFLGLSDKPRVAVEAAPTQTSESSRGRGWTWVA